MKISRIVLAVLLPALICAAFTPFASAGVNKDQNYALGEESLYMVKADIAATAIKPGVSYTIENGVIGYSYELKSPLVYGNIVSAAPLTEGEFAGIWAKVAGGAPFDDEYEITGYVNMAALVPMPDVEFFEEPEPCRFIVDSPELFLLPGAISILDYTVTGDEPYYVLAGEVTDGIGAFKDAEGRDWTLLRFNSYGFEFAFRHAWTRSENVTRLSRYEPDHTKADPALVPRKVRDFGHIEDKFYQSLLLNGFALDAAPILHERLSLDDLVESYPNSVFSTVFTPNFITTDLFLHVFHLVFSRNLKKIEEFNFAPVLETMLTEAITKLSALEKKSGTKAKATFDHARDFLIVPATFVQRSSAKPLEPSARARKEIKAVSEAEEFAVSEISGREEDYSFYKPRGHYTTSELLSNYFRAMAYLGGISFQLDTGDVAKDRNNTALTALLCILFEDENLRKMWDSLFDPMTYLVGAADDPTIREYGPIVRKFISGGLDKLSDAATLDELRKALIAATPAPRIIDIKTGNVSQEEREVKAAGLRLLGRRFVLDAWVFAQLTSPNVGSDSAPRNLPKVADVMASLGSEVADNMLQIDRHNIPKYTATLEKVKKEVYSFFEKWDGTLVSSWLGTLGLYLKDKDSKQFFWNTPLWEAKKLLTASASWTELKHDTLLYAKQSYAEMGAGGEWCVEPFRNPVPLGYVEPSPRTFDAITTSLSYLLEIVEKFGLEGRNTEKETGNGNSVRTRIEALLEHTKTFRDIARKEVNEERLSRGDYLSISRITSYLNANLLLDSENYAEDEDSSQLKMALVTDVATDAFDGRVLQVATGTPRRLYVFVNDKWGGPRVTIGYTYSYYEFPRSLSDGRMTDEQWKELVYDKTRQDELEKLAPEWSENLFVR